MLKTSSVAEQVAQHLRKELEQGRWTGLMPGRNRLVEELGVNGRTVERALERLEQEGLLQSRGRGRRRRIKLVPAKIRGQGLNVKILHYDKADQRTDYFLESIFRLHQSGHRASFAEKSLRELNFDLQRVAKLVGKARADAWIVAGGPRALLEWFVGQPTPAFALFGRMRNVPIAGVLPDKLEAIGALVDRLVALGHRRIVNIVAEERRKPTFGVPERFYMELLSRHGIQSGSYNLPDWEGTPEGLPRLLDSLFKYTPPTALLLDQACYFCAARDHLARKEIVAPRDVSMACYEWNPLFDWFRPEITHIDWDPRAAVNRIVKWVNNISRGKDDRRKNITWAQLIEGGTIGPVPKS
ncbi:GntR family transcriptional regulator [Haloferula sp. A504]|uniref:GntR family transcriptional regulator n=1 Tax=Haloferula sp. A504 TaxID=3373601 RepID=UPI0031C0A3AA|nr:substrate-binding domain-containing protein [Verrucomicrobiaceae bacterium E54]